MVLEVVNLMVKPLVLGEPIANSGVVQFLVQLGRDTAMLKIASYWGIAEKLHVLLALLFSPVTLSIAEYKNID